VPVETLQAVEITDSRHWRYWAHYTRLRGRAPLLGLAGLVVRSLQEREARTELRTLPGRTSATCVLARRVAAA
jgi:hypothetical protein